MPVCGAFLAGVTDAPAVDGEPDVTVFVDVAGEI